MSDKSEALSQPVGLVTNQLDGAVIVESDQLLPGDNVYSHEYVTALLAALEEANKQLSGEESVSDMTRDSAKYWKQRAEAAEQRLQQPALADVIAERQRQVGAEGYDHFHDDSHVNDEIAALAAWYVMPQGARGWDTTSTGYGDTLGQAILPGWRQPTEKDRRRELVIGAALTLAEIERLDRAAANLEEGR